MTKASSPPPSVADDASRSRSAARPNGLTYADAGVSIEAGAELVERIGPAVARTQRSGSMGAIGGFAGLFDPKAAGYKDPVLAAATDGVGTKLKIAIETGILRGVGEDLVAMCVNDLLCQGAEPLFFLDYFATGRLDPERAAEVVAGVAAGCEIAGCALIGGETAEMPGLYAGDDFDLAGFAVGAMERGAILPRAVAPGDVAIGLASSGPHSNGFALIRRIVADAGLEWDAPAPFAPQLALGAALLEPTRIYVRALLPFLRDGRVKAMAHITGGGLTENAPRALGPETALEINLGAWSPPPVFGWLAKNGGVSEAEMLRSFNCGIGMIAIVDPADADPLAAALAEPWAARPIGRVAARDGAAVRYLGALAL